MVEVQVSSLSAGSYWTEPIFLDEGFILTVPEVPLGQEMLSLLADWEFQSVKTGGAQRSSFSMEGVKKNDSLVNDSEKLEQAETKFLDMVTYAAGLFNKAALSGRISYGEAAEKVRVFIEEMRDNRRYLLQVQQDAKMQRTNDYLGIHAVRSLVISIVIGFQLKLPNHKLTELGVASLLHEIGMSKLPENIYGSDKEISAKDKEIVHSHPLLGYNLLKNNDFPPAVSSAALEHHERENGSGYPRGIAGDELSLYSKIISVACSFEAITAVRPFKNARNGFEGIIDLLKNKDKGYNDIVVRALVQAVSVYPIGSYVMLSNNNKARVIEANPQSPRFPTVQILDITDVDGRHPILETSPIGVNIVRTLTQEEIQ